MKGSFNMLKGKKTYVMAAIAALTAVVQYLYGDVTFMEASQLVFTAVLAATIRKGISETNAV